MTPRRSRIKLDELPVRYTLVMARGWESKSVEQQQEEARASQPPRPAPLTPEQIAAQKRRQTLLLSRQQVVRQLQLASHPRHRQMLETALAELDARLGK